MAHVAPVVEALVPGGVAYLLAWERTSDAEWAAHIAWVELDGEAWKVRSARVAADEVRPIKNQDYTQVPRRTAPPG
jgi:hypothetical protein